MCLENRHTIFWRGTRRVRKHFPVNLHVHHSNWERNNSNKNSVQNAASVEEHLEKMVGENAKDLVVVLVNHIRLAQSCAAFATRSRLPT